MSITLQEKANLHNEKISVQIVASVKRRLLGEIVKSGPELSYFLLSKVFQSAMQGALTDVSQYILYELHHGNYLSIFEITFRMNNVQFKKSKF